METSLSGLLLSLKVGVLCTEHMVAEACDSPLALPLKLCRPIQYLSPITGTAHYSLSSPLNNGVTFLFLVKYESMFIYVKRRRDFHFEGRRYHVLSACVLLKNGALWKMTKKSRFETHPEAEEEFGIITSEILFSPLPVWRRIKVYSGGLRMFDGLGRKWK